MLNLTELHDEDDANLMQWISKLGSYSGESCPNCNRVRVMIGNDGKRRCQKCAWCIEDHAYDADLV